MAGLDIPYPAGRMQTLVQCYACPHAGFVLYKYNYEQYTRTHYANTMSTKSTHKVHTVHIHSGNKYRFSTLRQKD